MDVGVRMSKLEVSYSNKKLNGGNVMIFNMNSATDCPADALGMCPLGPKGGDGTCYAYRPEIFRPAVLPYRRRQEKYWKNQFCTADFVAALRKKTEYFRFSEAGDFRTQEDVYKMELVCRALNKKGIQCYGYTRRIDLGFTHLSKVCNLIVAEKVVKGCSKAVVLEKGQKLPRGKWHMCPGKNCMVDCRACANKNGRIAFPKH